MSPPPCCPARFRDPYEVEVAARIMRKWDDDDVADTDAQDIADTVLKVCGCSLLL